jgi:hypothetical protein
MCRPRGVLQFFLFFGLTSVFLWCIYNTDTPEDTPMAPDLSALRRQLRSLQQEADQLLAPFLARDPLLAGSVYTLRRRCGKPNCRCSRGHLHATEVLAYRGRGRLQNITPRPQDLPALRRLTEAYRRFRQARAALVKLQRQSLAVIGRIEALRREEGERSFRSLGGRGV